MSFQVSVALNDGPLQKKTVSPSTTILELHSDTMLIWKNNQIVYDISDESSVFGPATTLQQLDVSPISILYVYTPAHPCPSGDLRSIVPPQVKLIASFAKAASKIFNKRSTPSSSSSTQKASSSRKEKDNIDDYSHLFIRETLETPARFKTFTGSMFYKLKNEFGKLSLHHPEIEDLFLENKDMTYAEFEGVFRTFLEGEVYKNEVIQNNPNCDEAKMYMEAKRNKALINEQYMHSLAFHPEDEIAVTMLYINLTINGVAVKAFVDSGAQKTIMSMACAERCGVSGQIDRRFHSMARGVGGSAKIIGKIHLCNVKVEDAHFLCPFEVMSRRENDLLLGLNVLRKYACCINLKNNRLEFGNGTSTPFLQSNEIDKHLEEIMAHKEEDAEKK